MLRFMFSVNVMLNDAKTCVYSKCEVNDLYSASLVRIRTLLWLSLEDV